MCQVGNYALPGVPTKPVSPSQEPKSAHYQQLLMERTASFQTLWLLLGWIKQNKLDPPLSLPKSNQVWMSHLTFVSITWVPQM